MEERHAGQEEAEAVEEERVVEEERAAEERLDLADVQKREEEERRVRMDAKRMR